MNKRLIEHLRQNGFIDEIQLRSAMARQQQFGGDILDLLIRLKMLSERECARGIATFYHYPLVDLNQTTPQDEALGLLDGEYARKHNILPVYIDMESRMVDVAVFDPARSLDALDFVRRRAGLEPRPHITPPTALLQAINYFYFGELPDRVQAEPGSTSGTTRALRVDGAGVVRRGGFSAREPAQPRGALRSSRPAAAPVPSPVPSPVGRRFDRGDAFGAEPSSGAYLGADPEPGFQLGGHAQPFERIERSGMHKLGALGEPMTPTELPSLPEVPSREAVELAPSQGVLELEQRVERLEEELGHSRRLVQMLLDTLVETGLANREELTKRMREEAG